MPSADEIYEIEQAGHIVLRRLKPVRVAALCSTRETQMKGGTDVKKIA